MRKQYLQAIIRQDVGWFDTNNPQELTNLIGSTQANISGALGASTWQMFEFIGMGYAAHH